MKFVLTLFMLLLAPVLYAQSTFWGSFPVRVLRMPQVHQTTDYTCGPSTVLSIVKYFKIDPAATEMSLATEMQTTEEFGTLYQHMQKALADRGLTGELRLNSTLADLDAELKAGNPVIVNFKSYYVGHYAIAIGVGPKYVYMMDPWFAPRAVRMLRDDFVSKWYDEHAGVRLDGMMIIARKPTL